MWWIYASVNCSYYLGVGTFGGGWSLGYVGRLVLSFLIFNFFKLILEAEGETETSMTEGNIEPAT